MNLLRPLTLVLALAALLLLAASGLGVRFDAWSYRTGFRLFAAAAWLGIAAALLAVVLLALPRTRTPRPWLPALAFVLGAAAFAVPFHFQRTARAVPPINDISTDTEHPPEYLTVARPYPGEAFARQQHAAYPDLAPAVIAVSPPEAFVRAASAAEAMGWEVVRKDPGSGRIEAVATTPWFGFKDDIAIRVSASGADSRVDVRSRSRVGRSDLGTNARRIRAYLQRLR